MGPFTDPNFQRLYPFNTELGAHSNVLYRSDLIGRSNLTLNYLDEGFGEPVVMLHGNPTWSFYYRNLVLALRDKFRCIVPDHIGCGLSDKPPATLYDYSLKSRIDDLEALLDHLGVMFSFTPR